MELRLERSISTGTTSTPASFMVLAIQKFPGKSHHIVIVFPLRLPLGLRCHQNTGDILQLRRRDTFHLRQRAVGRHLDAAAAGGQKQGDIFIGEGPPLVVQYDICCTGTKHQ